MNPVAILVFVLVAIALRAFSSQAKRANPLPPVAPSWPRPAPQLPSPKTDSDRPYVQDTDQEHPPVHPSTPIPKRAAPYVEPPARVESRPRSDRSPHEITERELTTAGGLDAPAGSALARLQASIEERRLALERRHAKGVSIRSADRGSSA